MNPMATLFCQARLCAERISTFPPEHDDGPDRGKQLIRSVVKNFDYPGPAVVLRRYASGVSGVGWGGWAKRRCMGDVRVPDGVRAGQLSVLTLGRVIMGDIAVTMVDLAIRSWRGLGKRKTVTGW